MDLLCHAIGYSEAQPRSPSSAPGPNRQCHICGRAYERADHLNRHLKSHENARSHKCSRCNKSFNRADLLTRHQAAHDRPPAERPQIDRRDRVASACVACVNAKAKCQDEKPCTRCQSRRIPCKTSAGGPQVTRRSSTSTSNSHLADQDGARGLVRREAEDLSLSNFYHHQNDADVQSLSNSDPLQHRTTLDASLGIHNRSANSAQFDMLASHSTYYPDLRPSSSSIIAPFLGYQDISSLPVDAYFSQDLDFGMWDFDLDSVELACMSENNTSSSGTDSHPLPNPSSRAPKDASRRYAAFERSPWLWTPTQKDQALNDQHHLDLDEENIPSDLTPASPATNIDDFSSCSIGPKERDKMLSLLFTLRKPPSKPPYLPSLALLNSIIHVYFVQESFKVDQLIHIGTFYHSKVLPQLLLAIVAAGSILISTPTIWKMGLALQEVVRHTVADYFEEDNSHTRNLQVLQAHMIGLDIGLWSGFKRKMEIAESFGQPIVIMLRRAGAFAEPGNQSSIDPRLEDSDAVLESKWRKWAERESFKRLVLHLFIHDIQASIGFQKPPLISLTELKFTLPAARKLWLAKTSTEWRDIYLLSPINHQAPTVADAIHIHNFQQYSSQVDIHLSAIVLLNGYFGQVWSLNESQKFFSSSKSSHQLWLRSAYTELYQDLSNFSLLLPSLTNNSTVATLAAELLQMILHVSPEDLHRFAGKFGEDETRKATEDFAAWAKTKDARIAIWHAGQVFRAAKELMPAQNRGFNAIALYYATLTLWVYGHMMPSTETASYTNTRSVILNEPESSHSALFLASSQGVPSLCVMSGDVSGGKTLVSLAEPDRILHVARDIYRNNYPILEERLPPLVENLRILLKDLGNLPGSKISRAPSEGPR